MQRILKLTPKTIKRLISEEQKKIDNERKIKLLEQLRILKKIQKKQYASVKSIKDLYEAKQILLRKIKGSK
jgi:hypothetical protein